MNFRRLLSAWWVLAGSVVVCAGQPATLPVVARVHWLGLNRIRHDANTARLKKIWHLPQTTALVRQTLDKLSRWPGGGATNAASHQLRPLLNDLVNAEWVLEVHARPKASTLSGLRSGVSGFQSQVTQFPFLLALRLPAARAALWQKRFRAAAMDLTGGQPIKMRHGWRLAPTHGFAPIELARQGRWTVIGVGPGIAAQMPAFISRLGKPLLNAGDADWAEADLKLATLARDVFLTARGTPAPGWGVVGPFLNDLAADVSRLQLRVSGHAGNVLARGTLTLAHPFTAPLPAWEIPTNYISQSLNAFTAVRGLSSLLANLPAWQTTGLKPAPDQIYFWSQSGIPFQTYAAFPLPHAAEQLHQLATRLVRHANPWLATHAQGNLVWHPKIPGLVWNGAMMLNPWLKAVALHHDDWAIGGLYALNLAGNSPTPATVLHVMRSNNRLVYYQAEQTDVRVDAGFYITQLSRLVFHKPQLPSPAAPTQWLKLVERFLGNCDTEVVRSNSRQLDLERISTLGMSALELHVLVDWLESSRFPHGLHTFVTPVNQH